MTIHSFTGRPRWLPLLWRGPPDGGLRSHTQFLPDPGEPASWLSLPLSLHHHLEFTPSQTLMRPGGQEWLQALERTSPLA